jgi:DNA (cytosine-5)-methyltransferase 1
MRFDNKQVAGIHRTKGGKTMLKVIELFSGIGSQTQALKNIGVSHEVIATSEIDRYALISYEALHGKTNNLGDITKIEELPFADLWTYSFPCQSLSLAGKKQGFADRTKSGLLFEVERLLIKANEKTNLPKYLLLENVKNLTGKKFRADYDKWLAFLNGLGYINYWKILNAKNYGIPQNRERVFCVSILGEHKPYVFPEPVFLELRLKDMLEDNVPESYYITDARLKSMLKSKFNSRRDSVLTPDSISPTLLARDFHEPKCVVLGNLDNDKYRKMIDSSKRVYAEDGLSPTILACGGGNTEPKVVIGAMRGRNPENPGDRTSGIHTEQRLEIGGGISNTLTTVQKDNLVINDKDLKTENEKSFLSVRKLTPKECFRLMGWKDSQIDKIIEAGISKTRMYRQAGNGIVLEVLEAVFRNLFVINGDNNATE